MKRFHAFCIKFNVVNPFPVSEQLLCSFISFLADEGLAPQTSKAYLSAVRNMQISLGLPDPREQSSLPILKRVQAGISRAKMLRGSTSRIRLPITIQILRQIHTDLMSSDLPEKVVIWAIASTAFFGFFRLGELLPSSANAIEQSTSLMWGDVAVDSHVNPTMVQVHLKKSKCDQFGTGSDIVLGRTHVGECPVSALLRYIEARSDGPGPFFIDSSHAAITKPWFVSPGYPKQAGLSSRPIRRS